MAEIRSIGVIGLGAMGAGIAQLAIEAGYDTIGREVTAELGEAAAGQDRALSHAQGREGPARAGRSRRRCGAAHDDDRARGARRLRSRDRGDRRGARAQAGALRRARPDLPARRDPRDEHVRAVGDRDRSRDDPARARRRDAFLQPGAADAAGRDRAGGADLGRRRSRPPRPSARGSARRSCAATIRPGSSSTAS